MNKKDRKRRTLIKTKVWVAAGAGKPNCTLSCYTIRKKEVGDKQGREKA